MAALLVDFVNIAPRTWLYTPPEPEIGELIVICTWLGASRKPIAKYTSLYQQIAPGARILLVESNIRILISYYTTQREAIKPAVSVILDTLAMCGHKPTLTKKPPVNGHVLFNGLAVSAVNGGCMQCSFYSPSINGTNSPKILLHAFSNGGTNTATQLLIVLNECTKAPVPFVGVLLDSCPAKGTYWKSYDAMVLSLPKNAAWRILGAVSCHCILILLYSWIIYGNDNPASLQRRTLLDDDTIRGSWELDAQDDAGKEGGNRRICYLYSKEDRMCDWKDVRDHAQDARRKGWLVKEVIFEGSGHCAHLSRDPTRYADAVTEMWQEGLMEWA